MDTDSLVSRLSLTISPPSLDDTASDWARVEQALSSHLDGRPAEPSLPMMRELGAVLRRGDWRIAAVLADLGHAWRVVRVVPQAETAPVVGLAIDLGTTTVAAELIDLETGATLASQQVYNSQRQFGSDVTTRMMVAEQAGGLATLRQAALDTLNNLVAGLCAEANIAAEEIVAAVLAGNTIMQHLLLGLNPATIRREPYVPTSTSYPILDAALVGLKINRAAPLYLLPAASGYVGGDVIADLLATQLPDDESLSILIDIGTNGETVLGNRDFLMACSGSAGSAFEGCGLEWGMPAQPGAIDRVWVENGRIGYRTVADAPVQGICGSGLIDALAEFLQADVIDRSGKVNLAAAGTRRREGHPEVVIAPASETAMGRDLTLRQGDIENLIRDKAALYAGSRILLANVGLTFDEVARIFIAGNFGQSLDVEQGVRIGLLPDIPRQRIHFIGNSALAGARATLLARSVWQRALEIAPAITCLELTTEPRYFDEYTAALFLPHTNLALFPSANTN